MDGPHSSESPGWRLSLVLPAYNEADCIVKAIEEANAALAQLTADYEILVVDDGSSDATASLVEELTLRLPRVRLLRHDRNRGYGAALRTGFTAARHDLVAFTDADCQFHLEDLGPLLELTDRVPVAVGYRIDRKDPWRRCLLSRGYNLLARTLLGTGVRDCDCALKVFRREALLRLLPETTGFFVNTEMLCRARQLGLEVAEVGVRHRPRPHGRSKVSLLDVPRVLARLLPFWWSRVLFPGGTERQAWRWQSHPHEVGSWLPLLTLLVLASLLFLTRLEAPLLEPQEPRYAEIARQMLAEGQFLVPVLHGQPYLDKPPLLYWLTMGSYQLFGVNDWSARLVPGLAGLLTVLLTYLWGRALVGPRTAFWGGLVLCLSARFVYLQRMLTFDCLLCLWVTAGLAAAHRALGGAQLRWGWFLLAAAACGLGLLTKGPVSLVLVGFPVLVFQFLDPRCPGPAFLPWAAFVGGAGLLAAPWYATVMFQEPEFASNFFWKHNVLRFVQPFDHAEPFWFHLPGLLLGLLPWTLLLPGLFAFLARRSARTAARRPPALGFCLLAWLWAVLFFSVSGCKRPVYILPALPPLALTLGYFLTLLIPPRRPQLSLLPNFPTSRLATSATLVVLLLSLGIVLVARINQLCPTSLAISVGAAVALGICLLGIGKVGSWPACAATTFVMLFAGLQLLLPAYNQQFALRRDLLPYRTALVEDRVPVLCYPQRWDSVSFYLPQAEVKVFALSERPRLLREMQVHPEALLLVKSGLLQELVRELPETVELTMGKRQGAVTVSRVRTRRTPLESFFAQNP